MMTLRDWLAHAPFTLCMSSGFFGFFAHCGMLHALEEEGLLPRRVVGSSAGGLVAGCWAAGLSADALRDELLRLRRADFWDPAPGPGLLRGRRFANHLERILPVRTFDACRVPLAVSVFDLYTRRTRVLDSGHLATAIRATACLPGLFQPVWLERRPLLDGGILDRPGHASLTHGERVLFHHLASKSPWRSANSPALQVPTDRPELTTLVIEGLTRVDPFHLERGHRALEQAARATRLALAQPLRAPGVVAVAAA